MDAKRVSEGIKKGFKKFWFLLWKDNSLKGWIFSLLFLFVFIKFIFFPGLSLLTGTSLPLAIVESCSMYHEGNVFSNFNNWVQVHENKYYMLNVTQSDFGKFPFKNGFDKGDILFIIKAEPDKLKIGDVILFASGTKGNPVIHRIIKIKEENGKKIFSTIGDNNNQMLTPSNNPAGVDEREISEEQLVGKALFRIAPWIGWTKLAFFESLRPVSERGTCKQN